MARRTLPFFSDPKAQAILRELSRQHGLTLPFITEMIEIQRSNLGRGKQIGITQDFNAAIAEFLDSKEQK